MACRGRQARVSRYVPDFDSLVKTAAGDKLAGGRKSGGEDRIPANCANVSVRTCPHLTGLLLMQCVGVCGSVLQRKCPHTTGL